MPRKYNIDYSTDYDPTFNRWLGRRVDQGFRPMENGAVRRKKIEHREFER